MKRNLSPVKYLILLALSISCSSPVIASSADRSLLGKIIADLQTGNLVIVYRILNADPASEQYADWYYYLDEFAASNAALVKAYPADNDFNRWLSANGANTSQSYTLFLFDKKAAYFYSGVIVEPMVYFSVLNSYQQGPSTYRSFLPEAIALTLE